MRPVVLTVAVVLAVRVAVRALRGRLSLLHAAATLTLVGALAAYGAGLFDLPNFKHVVSDLGQALGPYTYALAAVGAFLETGAFVGLIAPGETVLIVSGVVAGQGEIRLGPLIAIVWAAAVLGDGVSFYLGRRLGRDFLLRHGPRVKITEPRLDQVDRFLARRGGVTIVLGRFVGLVRAVAPFILGASQMSYRRFLPYDILGAGLWASVFCVLGYVFWQSLDRVLTYAGQGALALGTSIVSVVVAVTVFRIVRDPVRRREAKERVRHELDRPALDPVRPALLHVYRGVLRPLARRLRGPVLFVVGRITPGSLGLPFTTVMAVLSVSIFVLVDLTTLARRGQLVFGDAWVRDRLADVQGRWVTEVAELLTPLGTLPAVGVATAVVAVPLMWRRRWTDAAVLAVGFITTWLVATAVNDLVSRPSVAAAERTAFPATHAAYAIAWVALAIAAARAVPRWTGRVALVVGAITLAVSLGVSRLYLGSEYLSDVTGGWALGAAVYGSCAAVGLLVVHLRGASRDRT